ncbi:MAG: LysE/ArgO family amino acid transporter [Microbacteriaceae bacterium]
MNDSSFLTALAGFAAGATLIIAIGSQNAFVLRQGIRREHVLPVVVVCAVSDLILIAAGVAGVGLIVEAAPLALTIIRFAGAAFLIGYALLAARRAFRPQTLESGGGTKTTVLAAVLTAVALTWLNPHVYLDTVVLLGSLAVTHGPEGKWAFASGAGLASIVWFAALGYGARLLGRVFARPQAWRILDATIAVVMLGLAVNLLVR